MKENIETIMQKHLGLLLPEHNNGSHLDALNDEAIQTIYEYTGIPKPASAIYDCRALGRLGIVMNSYGPIYIDPCCAFWHEDIKFSILAHEYGHLFFYHPDQQAYLNFACCFNPNVNAAAMRGMELQSDRVSGEITAAAGRPCDPFASFLQSLPDTGHIHPLQSYYPRKMRVNAFLDGYRDAVKKGY